MKKGAIAAALFDLDGVVFDTEPQYSVFWGAQFRRYHPGRPGLENEVKGQTLDRIFGKFWSGALEAERADVVERLNDFEARMRLDYVAGFEDFVADLRGHGVKTAVVTSSNRAKMQSVYRKHPEFRALFDEILTSEDVARSKPSPECYLKAAARFGADGAEAVVFEDSINGLRSGRAAAMMVVGLLTTNPLEKVAPLSHHQIENYVNFDYTTLHRLWRAVQSAALKSPSETPHG